MSDSKEFKIAIVCAYTETRPVRSLLDDQRPERDDEDGNRYTLGRMGDWKVVIATRYAPEGEIFAPVLLSNLLRSFPNIQEIIFCGTAGGCPSTNPSDSATPRLGDVVISTRIFDCASEKLLERLPSKNYLIAEHYNKVTINWPISFHLYLHVIERKTSDCERPDEDDSPADRKKPEVFEGAIATSEYLLKDAQKREELRRDHSVLCTEIEANGFARAAQELNCPYLFVRGIGDYCDVKKNDDWNRYALGAAAAAVKTLVWSSRTD